MGEKEGEIVNSKANDNSKNNNSKTKIIPKKVLLEELIKKIDYFSSKNSVSDLDLYYLIKEFFAQFLELKYEFSLDELLIEIDKVYMDATLRVETIQFIEKVKIIEYTDSAFSPEYLKELTRQLSLIARKLARISGDEKKGFWKKFGSFFIKNEKENNIRPNETKKIPQDIHENKEIKTSNLENTADLNYSSKSNLEIDDLNELKKYEVEPKADIEIKTLAQENIEREMVKKNYSNAKSVSKNYNKKEKYTKTEKSDVDWTSEVDTNASKNDKDTQPKQSDNNPDFKSLLVKAKTTNKKSELVELYKQIHDIYDAGSVDFQAKYYKEIMNVFNKLSKMK